MRKRRLINILLTLLMMLGCFTIGSFAVSKQASRVVTDGEKLIANNYYDATHIDYVAETYAVNDGYKTASPVFYFSIPEKGAFIFSLCDSGNVDSSSATFTGININVRQKKVSRDSTTGVTEYICNAEEAGIVQVNLTQVIRTSGSGASTFSMIYIPERTNSMTASSSWSTYVHGTDGVATDVSKFKVKVPSKGYLILDINDGTGENETIYFQTVGMEYETAESCNSVRYIGVKKGTYTFNVQTNAAYYNISLRFVKISEGKYGTTKKKAVTLKKNSTQKGLIVVNGKVPDKIHWYKFRLVSNKKTEVNINSLISGGGTNGGLKVTIYGKNGAITKDTIYADESSNRYKLFTSGLYGKLKKGTYYIKIQNTSKGNGYFTVNWN